LENFWLQGEHLHPISGVLFYSYNWGSHLMPIIKKTDRKIRKSKDC